MTTYNGRSAQYVPGREVPNKEPPVSKFVVEKLYTVHRQRLENIEPMVDCHVFIPSFLSHGQDWKENAKRSKQLTIRKENQDIYNRIDKLHREEGYFTRERKEHVKRLENKLKYLKKLKDHGRMVQVLKMQKENEHFLKRIEKAIPQYSIKNCKEWYKHHENFKAGRKSDPTGGHIMTKVEKRLLPKPLPKFDDSSSMLIKGPNGSISFSQFESGVLRSQTSNSKSNSKSKANLTGMSSYSSQIMMVQPKFTLANNKAKLEKTKKNEYDKNDFKSSDAVDNEREYDEYYDEEYDEKNDNTDMNSDSKDVDGMSLTSLNSEEVAIEKRKIYNADHIHHLSHIRTVDYPSDDKDNVLITQRAFQLTSDGSNCIVKLYCKQQGSENLIVKAVSTNTYQQRVFAVKIVDIDEVYNIINQQTSSITTAVDGYDLQAMSSLMIKMFKEADADGSGSLTFDEFEKLMAKVDLGISYQELRLVISEADDNDNGVVDYEEFVPLAVDLLQSFRARNRAKNLSTEEDVQIDDQILKSISGDEIKKIADGVIQKLQEYDPKGYGLVKYKDMKRTLLQVGVPLGLRENEVHSLCQSLVLDQFGRVKYQMPGQSFHDSLMKVRFSTMKQMMVETRGTGLQNYLMDRCKKEEKAIRDANSNHDLVRDQNEEFVPTGLIPQRSMMTILSSSSKISLSRLQVIVIMSEANITDGMVNYFQFVPVCSKAIEIMFEPKGLRQRAELIENTDLSSEALLNGLSAEMFQQRLTTLFKSVDVDHSGNLDQDEFFMCLQSLELQLTHGEMLALFDQADANQNQSITFDEFMKFFTNNLLALEREKHLKQLQTSLQQRKPKEALKSSDDKVKESSDNTERWTKSIYDEVSSIFLTFDRQKSGFISVYDYERAIKMINKQKFLFVTDIIMSEFRIDASGFIKYEDTIDLCVQVLKSSALKQQIADKFAEEYENIVSKSEEIVESHREDIHHIASYIRLMHQRLKNEQRRSIQERINAFHDVIHNPHTGLTAQESNLVQCKLIKLMRKNMSEATSSELVSSPTVSAETVQRKFSQMDVVDFYSDLTQEKLEDIIFEAKNACIVRSLLKPGESQKDQIYDVIIDLCNKELGESEKKITKGSKSKKTIYLPVPVLFKILQSCNELRLNRSQLISIIATADCFDSIHRQLDAEKFAEHAATMLARLREMTVQQKRASVLLAAKLFEVTQAEALENGPEARYMVGWTVKDLHEYLFNDMMKYCEMGDLSSNVNPESLETIIRNIPNFKFTDADVATLLAALLCDEKVMIWEQVIAPCVSSIRSLCKERYIHRRVPLFHAGSDSHSFQLVRDLGEKILHFLKVNLVGDVVELAFPSSGDDESYDLITMNVNTEGKDFKDGGNVLFRGMVTLPYIKINTRKVIATSPSPQMKLSRSRSVVDVSVPLAVSDEDEITIERSEVSGYLSILAVGDTILCSNVALCAEFNSNITGITSNMDKKPSSDRLHRASISAASSVNDLPTLAAISNSARPSMIKDKDNSGSSVNIVLKNELMMRLPTIGLMDADSAGEFIQNLVSQIAIEDKDSVAKIIVED